MHIVESMSKIAESKGLCIYMPTRLGKHRAPYIKAIRKNKEASFTIADAVLRVGSLNKEDIETVIQYIENNRASLLEAFSKMLKGEDPGKVPFIIQSSTEWKEAPTLLKIETKKPLVLIGYFQNGEIKSLDFEEILKEMPGAFVHELADYELFKKASINLSMISWPNGLDIEIIDLYELGVSNKVAANLI